MKFNISTLALLLALVPSLAHAYQEMSGDPATSPDVEKKPVAQATTATTAIAAGTILSYSASDGYTVSVVGAATALGSRLIACVATVTPIASAGAYTLCQTKGYTAGVLVDTSGANSGSNLEITRGEPVCANAVGKGTNCGVAGSASSIISLDSIARGVTTGTIRVFVHSK